MAHERAVQERFSAARSHCPMLFCASLNFGYPWWLSYGHVPVIAAALLLLFLGIWRRWSKWLLLPAAAFLLWSSAAFLVVRFVIDINGRGSLPTQSFLQSGAGRILDIGAGTGRSTIMVLESRPHASVVALDLFADSFDQHFGPGDRPQDRLLQNLKAAGVDQRATIVTADMRKLPFESSSFDAAVSAYAVDHLNRQGISQALAEAARVIKPSGDFLLMLVGQEAWSQFAFGPLLKHMGGRGLPWWSKRLQEAGFQIREEGTRPVTIYLLARKP
jgi:ubiquinone/menaquinone biosynthesis C-methylase UbiE